MIATISKSVEFITAEITEFKQKCTVLKTQAVFLIKSNEELRLKMGELEHYNGKMASPY